MKEEEAISANKEDFAIVELPDHEAHCMVMLIDDDAVVAEALSVAIRGEPDVEMHYCNNPSAAIDLASEVKPTVILLDMVMPVVDGLTLLRYLRANEITKHIPVIALSVKEEAELKAEVFTAGGNDYLIKLPEKIELLARIRHHSLSYLHMMQRDQAFNALRVSQQRLAESNIKLQQLAATDILTGIANRRQFERGIELEWRRAAREKTTLSVALVDVDHFKNCNDRYGHQYGDKVLKKIANILVGELRRPGDAVARYGGEEFIIMLPNTHLEGAASLMERLRVIVEDMHLDNADSPVSGWVTVSAGVASADPSATIVDYEKLIREADKALYRAKEGGRNRVEAGNHQAK